jgi:hypothetical protein
MDFHADIAEDRRIFERFTVSFPARFKDSGHDYGVNVSLRNASAQGAKITTKEHLYTNDSVTLDVELPDCRDPLTIKGQVVWVRSEDPDVWDVGLKFYETDLVHIARLYKFIIPLQTSS